MFSLFKRLSKVLQAKANLAIDSMENPSEMITQALRDLRKDLQSCIESLAEVKASCMKLEREERDSVKNAEDYEEKALLLLTKAKKGELSVAEAEKLATEALSKKEQFTKKVSSLKLQIETQKKAILGLEEKVRDLKSQISSWEAELETLKAREQLLNASKKIEKITGEYNRSDGTLDLLEKMKEKIERQEDVLEAKEEIKENLDTDREINEALSGSKSDVSNSLEEMKRKLGIS